MTFVERFQAHVADGGAFRVVTFLPDRGDAVRLTYTELDQQARATAAWLTALGLTDQPVLLLHPAGHEFLAAFLGCLYARALAVPAALPQSGLRQQEQIRSLIRDCGARLVLTDAANQPLLAGLLPDSPVRTTDAAGEPDGWQPSALAPTTIAYLQYTSGSTSVPRGVQVTHRALLHNLTGIAALVQQPQRVLAGWLPHYHDMGLVAQFLYALYAGADLVFTAPATFLARPVRWLEMISRYRAEMTLAPDFGYAWCARKVTDGQLDGIDLSSLTMAVIGAEPILPSTLDAFTRRFAPVGFRPTAWSTAYGMAEATLMITCTPAGEGATVRRFDAAALEQHRVQPSPDGTPLVASGRTVDLDLRIVNPGTGEDLPDGSIGEIRVAGDSVAAGYHGHPDATEHTFRAGGSYLRTGDLGFLLDGDLYVTGRLKDLIIVNGRNLYPQDLEHVAREAHEAAGPGAAFAVTPPGGREHAVLVQEVRNADHDMRAVADAIITALGREFGIPVSLILVAPRSVDRTTSGKIRRGHMRTRFLDGQLTPVHQQLAPALTATSHE